MRELYCGSYGADPDEISARYIEEDNMFRGEEHVFMQGFG